MKLTKKALHSKQGVLLKNTIMLYILQFSTQFLSFIVVPYETRVLGNIYFGKLGVATAIMLYFQLFIDFGFLLSATEEVSAHREDKSRVSRILTAVTVNKIFLSIASFAALVVLCNVIPAWQEDKTFYLLFLGATAINSMIPDYLYRGMEQMGAITVRTVAIKIFFTVMIVLLLKQPEQYCLIPILNIIGNTVALLGVYLHLSRQLGIRFTRIDAKELWSSFRRSSTFFYSRIASTVYTASNTVILSIMSAGTAVGNYTLADKLITTAKSGLSPISDSMYPYMTKHKDFKLVFKILKIFLPIITIGCAVVFVFARPLLELVFGAGYGDAAPVLRAMLPVVIVILPSYILGFPTLSAMGLSKYANYSVVFGSALHVINLVVLYALGALNMVTMGLLVSVAETAILGFRIVVIYKYRSRLNGKTED